MWAGEPWEVFQQALDAASEMDDQRVFWALGYLAGTCDVKFSERVPTAAIIAAGEKCTVEISKPFVEEQIATPRELLFVLLHEIHHRINGDLDREALRKSPISMLAANIAADLKINDTLLREHFFEGMPLLRRMYGKAGFPAVLLLPPDDLLDIYGNRSGARIPKRITFSMRNIFNSSLMAQVQKRSRKVPEVTRFMLEDCGFKGEASKDLTAFYLDGWSSLPSFETQYQRLKKYVKSASDVMFLGNHGEAGDKLPEDIMTALRRALREDAGQGGAPEEERVPDVKREARLPASFYTELRRILSPDPMHPLDAIAYAPDRSVLPHPGRREGYLMGAGIWPFFFSRPMLQRDLDEWRVHLYLDASGSMCDVLPLVMGVTLNLQDIVGEPIYLFSNEVFTVTAKELEGGQVKTTWGTDVDCLIDHAVSKGFKKVLVISDGIVNFERASLDAMKSHGLELYLLKTCRESRVPLETLAKKTWDMDEIMNGRRRGSPRGIFDY